MRRTCRASRGCAANSVCGLAWCRRNTSTSTSSNRIPRLLAEIADRLAARIPDDIEIFAGLELGGIPEATALSLRTSLPVVFVRKHAKDYGTCRLAEGIEIAGKRLLIEEDVVTSGGQILASCEELRRAGAIVDHVVCVMDRQAVGTEALAAAALELGSLFTKSDVDALS